MNKLLFETYHLIIIQLRTVRTIHEPPSSWADSGSAYVSTNSQIAEKQPSGNQWFIGLTRGLHKKRTIVDLTFDNMAAHLFDFTLLIMSKSGGLKPRAVAGRPSVTRLTHKSWTGIRASGRPRAAVKNILQNNVQISIKFDSHRNLPHCTLVYLVNTWRPRRCWKKWDNE